METLCGAYEAVYENIYSLFVFVFSLQCNKLGWNFKCITCTRPLFFQCFHCYCIVKNCGMFLEKNVINLILAFWNCCGNSHYIHNIYIFSLPPSLYLSFPGRCLLTWVWSILNLQLNINLQVKHSWWVVNIRVCVLCSQWSQISLFSLEVECSCLTSTAALPLLWGCPAIVVGLQKPEIMRNKGCGGALVLRMLKSSVHAAPVYSSGGSTVRGEANSSSAAGQIN